MEQLPALPGSGGEATGMAASGSVAVRVGIPEDSPAGREEFATRMEVRRRAERAGEYEAKGWCLGSEEFRQEPLAQVSELAFPPVAPQPLRTSEE
jgi:hypothetical protein